MQTSSTDFKFEECNFTYPTGFSTVTRRLRICKAYPEGTIENWSIELNTAPEGKTFYKRKTSFGGVIENIEIFARGILPIATFDQFYEVKQHFTNSSSGDALGGFQSGAFAECTDKSKLDLWLEKKKEQGFVQVPYIRR